jgi:cell division septal protein FtsQ
MSPKLSQTRRATAHRRREIENLSRKVVPRLIGLAVAIVLIAVILAIFLPWIHVRFGH